jgi:hypothetical protein
VLTLQLAGQSFNKSEHRRALNLLLPNRSAGAIEFKHCNISAVMIELGYPNVMGYLPRWNFQRQALFTEVIQQVSLHSQLDVAAQKAVDLPAVVPTMEDFARIAVDPPRLEVTARENDPYTPGALSRRDYLAQEARNRSLGLAGEEFVVLYERWRLTQYGQARLADRIEHTAKLRGDGAGYDILSFDVDGRERFIEVKTTAYAKATPFFITDNELSFANSHADEFQLYRLFEFRNAPKLFQLPGRPNQHCRLDPTNFRASFG